MIKHEKLIDFLDSNGYYGLDEMTYLLEDLISGLYPFEDFVTDVKDFVEHDK